MASKEQKITKEIMLEFSRQGHRIQRYNSGQGYTGKVHRLSNGDILIKSPRIFRAAIKGTPDLLGYVRKVVTQEMVGTTVAIFSAVEVKSQGLRVTPEQQSFIDTVNKHGGLATVAYELSDIYFLNKYTKEKQNGL